MAKAYQNEVNNLLQLYIKNKHPVYVSYGDFCTFIPFWSRAMVVQDAKQIFKHVQKFNNLKLRLKTSQCCWHQPNFKIVDNELEIQVGGRFGIGDTLKLPIMAEPYQQRFLSMELGKQTIHPYKQWWAAELNVKVPEKPQSISTKRMGIDLGIKVPAVAFTEDGKIYFFGNGRESRFRRNAFYAKLTELQKKEDYSKIKELNHGLYRWMITQCHLISSQIVQFAVDQNDGVLCVEQLHGIGKREMKQSRDKRELNQWSYYRLIDNVRYKAQREGLRLVFVDPRYTSKRCPRCGRLNTPDKRFYRCVCGFHCHRDIVGAMNIVHAPESSPVTG